MGTNFSSQSNEQELRKYLKNGLTMTDLKNIRKAFDLLDPEKKGFIKYDINKLPEFEHRNIETENDQSTLTFEEFINMMTSNIAEFRKKYSKNVVFESETSNVSCIICPPYTK